MEIQYHHYEIPKDELDDRFLLNNNEKNWVFVDKSFEDKIVIHSGEKIDDLLDYMKIEYNYYGLKSFERKEISVVSC